MVVIGINSESNGKKSNCTYSLSVFPHTPPLYTTYIMSYNISPPIKHFFPLCSVSAYEGFPFIIVPAAV